MAIAVNFSTAAQWSGILTLVFAALAVLAFVLQWGFRFRLVGITGFMGVLTGGLFALGLVPFTRTVVPGAVRFAVTYDNGATLAVIAVPPEITSSQVEATLRQAANNLFSYGRLGQSEGQFLVRARTIIHPEPKVSKVLVLGQAYRSLSTHDDEQMAVELFQDQLAQLPKPTA